jgi:predicted DNA-binding helix-hairpin-helix protein
MCLGLFWNLVLWGILMHNFVLQTSAYCCDSRDTQLAKVIATDEKIIEAFFGL